MAELLSALIEPPCASRMPRATNRAIPAADARGRRDVPSGGVQVTIEGALGKTGDFEASLVMAKCSSKYDPQKHEMTGDQGTLPVN